MAPTPSRVRSAAPSTRSRPLRLRALLRPARGRLRPSGSTPPRRSARSRPGPPGSGATRTSCRSRAAADAARPGLTPLIRADRLAERLGLGEVWIKNDAANPTHSFKDRVVAVALAKARELGFETVACASTGNLANAVAAHAAAAGLDSYVFVPSDLEEQKLLATGVYGTHLVGVKGSYDDVNRLCTAALPRTRPWAFVNVNLRPYYAEGSKTLAYETVEQLGWELPDRVVVPDRLRLAVHQDRPRLRRVARARPRRGRAADVQRRPGRGLHPGRRGVRRGQEVCRPQRPDTIAKSLAIGNPPTAPTRSSSRADRRARSSRSPTTRSAPGSGCSPRPPGMFTETAGGVTTAVLAKLAERGAIAATSASSSTSPARA